MNNTTTKALAAIVVIFTAATLVVGGSLAATPTQSAYAYKTRHDGNTDTAQINKQDPSQSGFDNLFEEEAQNDICTHPSATCEAPQPTTGTLLVKKIVDCSGVPIPPCVTASAFAITVTGNNPTPSTFQGSESGTLVTLGPGTFFLIEKCPLTCMVFDTTFSGDCSGTIAAGEHKTCTITNTLTQ